ncbi:MAG: hypothetical protein ACOYI5_07550 [Christensenellales bacterium]
MKHTLFALAIFMLACLPARAQTGGFAAGANAAQLGERLFFIVDEGAQRALVKVDPAGKAVLAARADDMESLLHHEGFLYYLKQSGGAWSLMRRGEAPGETERHAFSEGARARALATDGENLFALVDDQLHILYPDQALCLKLAGARMREYVIADDYAYFISATDIISYELPAPEGEPARGEAGCLYRLNLSTGNTSLVLKAGVQDLKLYEGRLYFHNLADGYRAGETRVAGKLYAFDLATETLARELDDYDWDYFPAPGGLIVRRAGEIVLLTPAGEARALAQVDARAEVAYVEGVLLIYDPDGLSFFSVDIEP